MQAHAKRRRHHAEFQTTARRSAASATNLASQGQSKCQAGGSHQAGRRSFWRGRTKRQHRQIRQRWW